MSHSLRFADWTLRTKMAALLVAALLFPIAIWAYIDLCQDEARLLGSVQSLLEARGDQIVQELDGFHRGYLRSVEQLARIPESAAYCTDTPERRAAHRDGSTGDRVGSRRPALPYAARCRAGRSSPSSSKPPTRWPDRGPRLKW